MKVICLRTNFTITIKKCKWLPWNSKMGNWIMFKTWPLTPLYQVSFLKTQSFLTVIRSLFVTLTKFEHQSNMHLLFKSITVAGYRSLNSTGIKIQMMMIMSKMGRKTIRSLKYKKYSTMLRAESFQSSGKKPMKSVSWQRSCQM